MMAVLYVVTNHCGMDEYYADETAARRRFISCVEKHNAYIEMELLCEGREGREGRKGHEGLEFPFLSKYVLDAAGGAAYRCIGFYQHKEGVFI